MIYLEKKERGSYGGAYDRALPSFSGATRMSGIGLGRTSLALM